MWKIKHTEVIDVIPEEETKSVRVITRGKLLYVVSQDAEDQK
jgi:predicted SnoaL-like aldol condensation-catalyzing enzyme